MGTILVFLWVVTLGLCGVLALILMDDWDGKA